MNDCPPDPYREGLRHAAAGRRAEAIERFEQALALRPDDIRVLFALASLAGEMELPRQAEAFYRRVLALAPDRLEALVGLANLLRIQGKHADAEALLTPVLMHRDDAPELWLTLGSVHRETGDAVKAESCYRKALSLRDGYPPALGNLADLLADRGAYRDALRLYGTLLAREPDNAQARLNRAIIHLLTGHFEKGWRDYAARLRVPGKAPVPDHGLRAWNGRFHQGQRLLVTAEQGVGDQIMFASLLPDLTARAKEADARLVVECEPRLRDLFARSLPDIAVRPWRIEGATGTVRTHYDWLAEAGGADAAVPLGTLPAFLRRRIEDFPDRHAYLRADATEADRWRAAFSALPRPLIALSWRSGKSGGGRTMQYAPLSHWGALARDLPGSLIVAQYAADAEEIAELESVSGRKIVTPIGLDQKNELDRTAAMLSACDAVISAPTAVSWLSAAVGVFTCKIAREPPWTGFGHAYEPLAPSAVFAVPQEPGDWPDAFARAKDMVADRF